MINILFIYYYQVVRSGAAIHVQYIYSSVLLKQNGWNNRDVSIWMYIAKVYIRSLLVTFLALHVASASLAVFGIRHWHVM